MTGALRRRSWCQPAPLRVMVAVVSSVVAVLVLSAGPASAHAVLVSTDPPLGARVAASPERISLRFDEDVEATLGAVALFDTDEHPHPVGAVERPAPDEVAVAVAEPLSTGLYVVTWRVVSADGHPVRGAFTFRIGTDADAPAGLVARLLAAGDSDPVTGALQVTARALLYLAMAVATGGAALAMWGWARATDDRVARSVLTWSAVVAAMLALASIGLQGAYASGAAPSAALRPSLWSDVLATRTGRALGLRALGALVLLAGVRGWAARRGWAAPVLIGASVAMWIGTVGAGHAAVGRSPILGGVAGVVHVGAMSVWIGGLVLLAVCLRRGSDDDADRTARVLSGRAAVCVGLIVASGLVQSWREVGSLDALTSTTYGRLLAAKVAVVVALLGVAALSRHVVTRRSPTAAASVPEPLSVGAMAAPPVRDRRALARRVGVEVALAAVVLALTSVLVSQPPARAALSAPFSATLVQGDVIASIAISPARAGTNELHLYLQTPGGVLDVASDVSMVLVDESRDLGPVAVPLEAAGPNHWTTTALDLPFAGTWRVEVRATVAGTALRFDTAMRVGA